MDSSGTLRQGWGGTHRWGSTHPPRARLCQGGQALLSVKTCLYLGAQLGPVIAPVPRIPSTAPPRLTAQPPLGTAKSRSYLRHYHVSERTTEARMRCVAGHTGTVGDWHLQAASSTMGIPARQGAGGGVESAQPGEPQAPGIC